MNCELTVKAGNQERKAFLQEGFYRKLKSTVHMHRHNYAEVHLVSGGTFAFDIEGKCFVTQEDTLLIVPAGKFHSYTTKNTDTLHSAFQIEHPAKDVMLVKIEKGIIEGFLRESRSVIATGDYSTICAYIALFCSYFGDEEKICGRQISDYGFLIGEFFSNKYNTQVCLEDLAEILCLSPRQTERCVLKYTGMTFREKLASTRIAMARQLRQTSDMPLQKIADYVGYRSYSGFWKAFKKAEK